MKNIRCRVRIGWVGTLFLIGLMSGCVARSRLEPLEMTLSNLAIEDMTLMETTLVANVRIVNPNPESLEFSGATCKLYLEGGKVGRGVSSESFSVDRLSTRTVKISFFINNIAALYRLRKLEESQKVAYKLKTTLFSERSYGTKKYRTTYEGILNLENSELGN